MSTVNTGQTFNFELSIPASPNQAVDEDEVVEPFRGSGFHGLGCWFRFEDARLLRQWVHTRFGFRRRCNFQFQVEHTRKVERSRLFYLFDSEEEDVFNCSLQL